MTARDKHQRIADAVNTMPKDLEFHRACPHCGGKNTGYWITGVEEQEWFTTVVRDDKGATLFAFVATSIVPNVGTSDNRRPPEATPVTGRRRGGCNPDNWRPL